MLFRPSGISSLGLAGLKDLCVGSRSLELANVVYDFFTVLLSTQVYKRVSAMANFLCCSSVMSAVSR